ncbi:MAG TPA: ABC transporter substrate-binding protein [Candidatus Binatia bacterium]|nr:ABC transporter substrate-binding protein [Candidatus Binatia bacterium]
MDPSTGARRRPRPRRRPAFALLAVVALAASACSSAASPRTAPGSSGPATAATGEPIRIGAVFPLDGNAATLAGQELRGVRIAADLVNADGGIDGRPIVLDVQDLESRDDAPAVMAQLVHDGATAVIGAYSSDLSIAASQAASAAGLLYWEAGAVADQLTGQGLPLVFRVGASGTNLGTNSAAFTASQLAPRLGTTPSGVRLAIVNAEDAYADSVAAAASATAAASGVPVVAHVTYDLSLPRWPQVMAALAAARPDVVILASHIPDGIAFRQAMLAAGLHVKALIGSTMAECDPDFAGELGPDAIGIFASDRPTGGFQAGALDPSERTVYERLATAWAAAAGSTPAPMSGGYGYGDTGAGGSPAASSEAEYPLTGPDLGPPGSGPTEEGLSGFSAAWALFHDALPAVSGGTYSAEAIATAARSLDLPEGSLPNGAGLRFSSAPATLGQNERAAAVIWQWQAVRSYQFVWPATYATGSIAFVPLAR